MPSAFDTVPCAIVYRGPNGKLDYLAGFVRCNQEVRSPVEDSKIIRIYIGSYRAWEKAQRVVETWSTRDVDNKVLRKMLSSSLIT